MEATTKQNFNTPEVKLLAARYVAARNGVGAVKHSFDVGTSTLLDLLAAQRRVLESASELPAKDAPLANAP